MSLDESLSTLEGRILEAEQQRDQSGAVWRSLRSIAVELDRFEIPFVVAGALSLQHHGLIGRSTNDVDLIISSPAELDVIHQRLVGNGWTRKSPGSRHIRDDVTGVRVEFLVAGEYPGDGLPKSVRFPSPRDAAERSRDGIPFLNLRTLIELKLASAKSASHRIKDRADVLELIHLHRLTSEFTSQLDPYVQQEFRELAALPPASEPD